MDTEGSEFVWPAQILDAQSAIVAAAGNVMGQIRKMVTKLDEGQLGVMKLSVYATGCADAGIVQEAMTTLFASSSIAAHTQTQITTAEGQRELSQANSMCPRPAPRAVPWAPAARAHHIDRRHRPDPEENNG
jgi:hypothetical protein